MSISKQLDFRVHNFRFLTFDTFLIGVSLGLVFFILLLQTFNTSNILNNSQNEPPQLQGPTSGVTNTLYTYTLTMPTDPNNDNFSAVINWGDGIESDCQSNISQTEPICSAKHGWASIGNYEIRAHFFDERDTASNWSQALAVSISTTGNNYPPNTPTLPLEPTSVTVNKTYRYSSLTKDPDNNEVRINFNSGESDYASDWVTPEETVTVDIKWNTTGIKCLKVYGLDTNGNSSPWSNCLNVAVGSAESQTQTPFMTPDINSESGINEFGEYYNSIGSFEPSERWESGNLNPTMKRHGNQALTLTSLNHIDNMTTRVFDTPLDLTKFAASEMPSDDDDFIDLWGYQHDLNLDGGSIHLDASPQGEEWTNYFSYYTLGDNKMGWRLLHVPKSEFTKNGQPGWNNIRRARISIASKAQTTSSFTFDLWRHVSKNTTFTPADPKQGVNIRCQGEISPQSVAMRAKELGAEYVRIPFYWNQIEKAHGIFIYSQCNDDLVNAANSKGLNILAILYGTPQWARKDSCQSSNEGCPPKDPSTIQPFIQNIMARYPEIHYWEIWNEPNSPNFWAGENPTEFVPLITNAYQKIKEIRADKVVLGGIYDNGEMPIDWMDQFFKAGGGVYADIVAIHPYTSQIDPNSAIEMSPWNFRGHLRAMRAIMAVYGYTVNNKELWATEFGFTTGTAPFTPRCNSKSRPCTETEQGQWSIDVYDVTQKNRFLQGFFIYELVDGQNSKESPRTHEGNFGLVTAPDLREKTSFNFILNRFGGKRLKASPVPK